MPSNLQTDENGHIKRGPGRPKGSENKVNREFRETVRQLLEDNSDNVQIWLKQVAAEDPDKALQRLAQLAEFAAPKLSRAEVTGADGGPVQIESIDIVLRKPGEAEG